MKSPSAHKDLASQQRKEANSCLALGVGVGALGAIGAAVSGAVCPACIVVAPGLVGIGVVKRWLARRSATRPLEASPSVVKTDS